MEAEGRHPWITVYDPQGFMDPWINPYLTFLAWQGATPTQIRRQARHLVAASLWLDVWDAVWPTHSLGDWGMYYRLEASGASLRILHSHMERYMARSQSVRPRSFYRPRVGRPLSSLGGLVIAIYL